MTNYGQELAPGAIPSKPRTEPPPPPPPSRGHRRAPDVTLMAADTGDLTADCDRCGWPIHDDSSPIQWTALAAKVDAHTTVCTEQATP